MIIDFSLLSASIEMATGVQLNKEYKYTGLAVACSVLTLLICHTYMSMLLA